MTQIAIFAGLLFIQEQVLMFIPNVQLTVLLIVVFSTSFGFLKTAIIVLIHTLLDCLLHNNMLYFPFMLAGWLFIPLTMTTIFKKVKNIYLLSSLGILFALVYSWMFVIANALIGEVDFIKYLLSDIVFEIVLAASSFLSILWLYEPLKKGLLKYL